MTCRERYREHQVLWNFFSGDPDAERDFLFRYELNHGNLKYFILSRRIPRDTTGTWKIESKKFDPCLQKGQKLAFVLRANPVITVKNEGGKARRHDVVMHEKYCMGYKNLPVDKRPSLQEIAMQGGSKWLSSRAEKCGFTIFGDNIRIEGYQQHQAGRGQQKKPIQFSTIDFEGVLMVNNPDRFINTLHSGIGKSKAFGCGLLLVRKI
jgi:CRISPR system Cascade subunit CasE